MMRFRVTALILFTVLAVPTAEATSPDPLFQDDAPLRVEITAPFSRLINERPKDREFPGSFSFKGPDGVAVELDLQVRTRGKFRHTNCDFPPLFLNFKRSQVGGTLFENQNKLKMVVHCKDSGRYQQSVLREYLAYRLLNLMTDRSIKVRLLDVTYVDSENRRPRMVRSAFLIEHENRLADRLDMQRLNIFPKEFGDIKADHLNLTSVFQFLLGNTDFSPILGSEGECCHNYSMFGTDNVRQRLYQGFCVNNRFVEASVAEFMQSREALYALVADVPGLDSTVRQRLANYMDEFYVTISDSQGVEQEILTRCIEKTAAG